jgi:tyrosine-specific transport protein
MNKKFWATTFTLSGAIMGAGILGLPFVFAKSGFLAGLFWLIFLGAIMTYLNLTLGEVTLRTRGIHQLPGYAKKYLGNWGKRAMFFAMIFGIYSALLAYLLGEGESFSNILPGNINPVFLGVIFWGIMTFLLQKGIKQLKKIEMYGVGIIILIILGMFIQFFPQIQSTNLATINPQNFTFPIGIILFALLGFTSIPELRQEIKGQEKLLKKAILIGTLIPIILYILFTSIFIGILGKEISEIATLSFGPIITILGIFTMLTSYFVLSFSLKDTFKYDLKLKKKQGILLTSGIPLIIYLLISKFQLIGFTQILGVGGVISGGFTAILILLIHKKSKKSRRNNKEPEINIKTNLGIIIFLSIIFITGIILEFIN